MLTAFQVETAAYVTESGELLCPECFDDGDTYAKPVSRYGLDEWQTAYAEDHEWDEDDGLDHAECEPALYDDNGHELLAEYHYGHDTDEVQNEPAPRWVPCSQCGARDGERHRSDCPALLS